MLNVREDHVLVLCVQIILISYTWSKIRSSIYRAPMKIVLRTPTHFSRKWRRLFVRTWTKETFSSFQLWKEWLKKWCVLFSNSFFFVGNRFLILDVNSSIIVSFYLMVFILAKEICWFVMQEIFCSIFYSKSSEIFKINFWKSI